MERNRSTSRLIWAIITIIAILLIGWLIFELIEGADDEVEGVNPTNNNSVLQTDASTLFSTSKE
jgi:hypothetical protein